MLLRQAGFQTRRDASIANLGIGVLKALSTICAMLLVDRYGRRRLLLVGTFMMVLSLIVLASVLMAYPPPESDVVGTGTNGVAPVSGDGDVGHMRRGGGDGAGTDSGHHIPAEVKWTTLGSLAAYETHTMRFLGTNLALLGSRKLNACLTSIASHVLFFALSWLNFLSPHLLTLKSLSLFNRSLSSLLLLSSLSCVIQVRVRFFVFVRPCRVARVGRDVPR